MPWIHTSPRSLDLENTNFQKHVSTNWDFTDRDVQVLWILVYWVVCLFGWFFHWKCLPRNELMSMSTSIVS